MFNKKNLSVIFAVVLLCASVVGVFFIGAQAAGTKYYMTVGDSDASYASKVPSDMSFIANYSGVAEAVAAAKGRSWAAKDTLTIYIASSSTAAPTFASTTAGRHLFNTYTIFRGDNTKLPIEINGDDPSTSAVEKNSLGLGTPTWNKDYDGKTMTASFIAANDYTFKNLDLSAWANSSYVFYSGSANVTFDNVVLSTASSNEKLIICSQIGAWTPFEGWSQAKYEANKSEGDLIDSGFSFKNTTYGYANGTLTGRHSNLNLDGDKTVNDLTISNHLIRNKLVFLEGATAQNVFIHSVTGMNAERAPYENVIEVDGGYVGVVYGVRSNYPGAANRHVCNVKSGTLGHLRMGSQSGATFTGDIVINWTGGKIENYGSVFSGKVVGNVYNNIKNVTFTAVESVGVGFSAAATIDGTLYNNFTDSTLSGQVYLGAKGQAKNVANTLAGTITSGDNYAYLGTNGQTITGTITNNVACEWVYTGTGAHYLFGGSNSGATSGLITNNIKDGAKITGQFIGGSNGGTVIGIENYILGGSVTDFLGGNGFNNTTTLPSVKSHIIGGTISVFRGASANNDAIIEKVENYLGKKNEDGSYTGTALVNSYYGGSYDKTANVGLIENTFYAGTLGFANRDDSATWFNKHYGYGGSYLGTVGAIRNTFYGGVFNTTYFYCGNNSSHKTTPATFSSAVYDRGEEAEVINHVYGGHFARFAGASNGGHITSVENYVRGASKTSISARDGAIYCGHGATEETSIYNEITGFSPVSVGNDGLLPEEDDLVGQLFGGNNGGTIGSIENVIKNDAVIGHLYSACNGGTVNNVKNTITKDADSEVEPEIEVFFGGSRAPTSGTITTIVNTVKAGEINEFYAGHHKPTENTEITTLTNNLEAGKIWNFYGGNNQYTDTVNGETVYQFGAIGNIINNVLSGSTIHVEWLYAGGKTGNVVKVTNRFQSENATFGVVYGGAFGTGSFKIASNGGVINEIVNTVSKGKFENFYGGSRRGSTVKITNSVTGGTFGEFYGANNQATLENATTDNAVLTTISGATFSGNVYGGSYFGEIKGNIKTVFTDGTYNGDTFSGNRFGNITGNVAATINGGTFNRYFGGSDGLDLYNKNHYPAYTTITGDVTNYINGGTFTGATTKDSAAENFALVLGGNYGNIVGSVTNNLSNAGPQVASGKIATGGGFMNNITAGGSKGYAIQNNISSGTYYSFWGGSYRNANSNSYKVTGKIENYVSGGTFNTSTGAKTYNAFSGGCINAGHTGNVYNKITGGTFNGYLNPGTYVVGDATLAYRVGTVTTDLYGGTFNGSVHVCGFSGYYVNGSSKKAATMNIYNSAIAKSSVSTTYSTYTTGTVNTK